MQEDMINQHAHPSLPATCPISCEMGKEYAPLSPTHIANPYAFYARAREEEPVFYSPLLDMWIVTRHEDVTTVLRDYRRFSMIAQKLHSRCTSEVIALMRTSPLSSIATFGTIDPPDHTRLRNCTNKALSAQPLISLEPRLRHVANQLIDAFESQGQTDFMTQFVRPYTALVTSSLLGLPETDMPRIKVWTEHVFDLLFAVDLPAEQQLSYAQSWIALDQYLYDFVEQGRMASQDTFASDLFKASEASQAPLSIAEIATILRDMLHASIVTSRGAFGNCLYHVLAEHHHWQAILDDPHLIPAMVEEALRLDTSGLGTFRMTNEAVGLGGKTIPQGALIQVLLASANHDEAAFPDAGTFHLHREKLNRHVAFGYGVHSCAGAPVARLGLQIALEQLSQRLPSLHLVPDYKISYTANLALRELKQLLLAW